MKHLLFLVVLFVGCRQKPKTVVMNIEDSTAGVYGRKDTVITHSDSSAHYSHLPAINSLGVGDLNSVPMDVYKKKKKHKNVIIHDYKQRQNDNGGTWEMESKIVNRDPKNTKGLITENYAVKNYAKVIVAGSATSLLKFSVRDSTGKMVAYQKEDSALVVIDSLSTIQVLFRLIKIPCK